MSNEIIRFIKEKHYNQAEKKKNRKDYVEYLKTKKFVNFNYLADMPIHRMTKDEVSKQLLLVKELKSQLRDYNKIFKSKKQIKNKLIEELRDVSAKLDKFLKKN